MADRALQERTKEKSESVAEDAEKYRAGPVQPGALDLDTSTGGCVHLQIQESGKGTRALGKEFLETDCILLRYECSVSVEFVLQFPKG